MKKDKTENKDQSQEKTKVIKKSSYSKKKKLKKIYQVVLHMFNQHLITQ
tara:strand:- start:1028 stop:1174 length:147 start_codon:yes stop_codon:yes gene_type:complete